LIRARIKLASTGSSRERINPLQGRIKPPAG